MGVVFPAMFAPGIVLHTTLPPVGLDLAIGLLIAPGAIVFLIPTAIFLLACVARVIRARPA